MISKKERGFTLTEVLVATAIFAIIFIAALMVYDRSNRTFKAGVEASDVQQNVRVGYEKMVSDIRMAGFDYDRDGFPSTAAGRVWQASTAYGLNAVVTPITSNGFTYVCSTAGTSGAFPPAWSPTVGGITFDGTVRWTTQTGINQYQQSDEQIEYAGAHAITLRGNFDFENSLPAEQNGREPILETPQFPVVTTGNDEVVTYALRSTQTVAGVNPDRIQFFADMPNRRTFPGGRAENPVEIPNVDLCRTGCNSPPYTLFRFTFTNPSATSPGGALVTSPLATNIRGLDFQYYSDAIGQTELTFLPDLTTGTPPTAGGGQYNPAQPNLSIGPRARRAAIRSVRVRLTGMTETPLVGYQNPAETTTSPAKGFQTFPVESLIVPRNLGRMGAREQASSPPGAPRLGKVCMGYCGIAYVEWQAPSIGPDIGEVEQYVVLYDTISPPTRGIKNVGPATSAYVDGLDPTEDYYFTVMALNSFGSAKAAAIVPAAGLGLDSRNSTTPDWPTPVNMTATGNGAAGQPAAVPNQIALTWENPATQSGTVVCFPAPGGNNTAPSPIPSPPGEITRYEVLRSTAGNFDPTDPTQFEVISSGSPNELVIGTAGSIFVDRTAVPCKRYYYRVRAIENSCANPADATRNKLGGTPFTTFYPDPSDPAWGGVATPSGSPDAPAALLPALPPAPASTCGVTCDIYLQWPKVTTDTNSPAKPMIVDTYVITRERLKNGVLDTDFSNSMSIGPALVTIEVVDSSPVGGAFFQQDYGSGDVPYYRNSGADLPTINSSDGEPFKYRYSVQAKLACSPERLSASSPQLLFPCPFTAPPAIPPPPPAITLGGCELCPPGVPGTSPGTAWQTDGTGTSLLSVSDARVVEVQLILTDLASSAIVYDSTITGAPYDFTLGGLDPGSMYRVYVISKNAAGCLDIQVRYLEEGTTSGCCLNAQADNPFVVQFTPGASFIDVFLFNDCNDPLTIQSSGINIAWRTVLPTPAGTRLTGVEFPAAAGGTIVATVNDVTGLLTVSPPVGAKNPIDASSTYKIQLQFDRPLTDPSNPLRNFCVTYLRPGIDDPADPQRCRIVPEPITFNSCN